MMRKLTCLTLILCLFLALAGDALAQEEKPVLRYLGRDVTFDLLSSPMIPIIEEYTGYTVEYESLPAGEEGTTKMMLLLASGTSYDLVNVNPDMFDKALASHAVMPLNELLASAPNLMAAVPEDSTSWDRVTGEDGLIYGVPQKLPTGGPVNAIAVRKDLLDAAGIAMPTTADELYEALVAIRETYPDMIPLTTDSACSLPPVISAFNCYQSWYEVDGVYLPPQLRPEYREYIEYVRKLYTEGLLDPEFPANDSSTRLAKFTSGKAVMTFFGSHEGPGFYSALEEAVPGAQVDYLPFLKDSSGQAGVEVSLGLEKVCFIPKSAAHPEDAMAWIDAFMANFKAIYIGEEGVDHEVVNGEYRPIMPAFGTHDTVWWFMPAVVEAEAPTWWQARVRKSEEVERGYMDTFALKVDGLNIVESPLSMVTPNEELTELQNVAGTNWNVEMIKIITGAVSMEDYDKALEQYKADGGDRIVELANQLIAG